MASWADVPDDCDNMSSLMIQKLLGVLDETLDKLNDACGFTEPELEWVKHDIRMWLEWKIVSGMKPK